MIIIWILIILVLFGSSIGRVESMPDEISMGTTIVSVKYKDGCIMGADTRTSVSGYVSNRLAAKLTCVLDCQMDSLIIPYNDSHEPSYLSTCCIGRSGSAADTQYLADSVRNELLKRQTNGRLSSSSLSIITISNIARILQMMIRQSSNNNNMKQYSASLLCAGYDAILQQGVIYSIMPGGTCMEETNNGWAISGSGSTYITGYMMDHYKPNMTEKEAIQFVQQALSFAIDRDGSSGGMIRMTIMNSNGKRELVTKPNLLQPINAHNNNNDDDVLSRNSKLFAPPIVHQHSKK